MEKFYLGISLGFNSSACVVSNERGLLSAISQERINGIKNTKELPLDAAVECIKNTGIDTIEKIIICHYENITDEYFEKYGDNFNYSKEQPWNDFLVNYLTYEANVHVVDVKIERVNHHVAHGASTFGFYGFPKSDYYLITSDGFGDGVSGMIYRDDAGCLSEVTLENSIALVYQFVTGALGFKEHQHEGKITGLAAFGKPIYLKDFEDLYKKVDTGNGLQFKDYLVELTDEEIQQAKNSPIIDFDKFLMLKKTVYKLVKELQEDGAKREDIAASVQEFAEKYTLNWIKKYCKRPARNAYLAGGLFANVKINQRVKDLGIFKEVYVCPAMGDEGTCVGAVIHYLLMNEQAFNKMTVDNASKKVISGTSVDGDEETFDFICNEINRRRLQDIYRVNYMRQPSEVIEYIANALAKEKIVCLMRDKMEFGPRALCHRSILYNCNSKETNDWLNKKLGRTEFMPFAPVCRKEVADDLFKNLDGGRNSARFMTMTFDCSPEFIQNYPAACHIDNTARPQIVDHDDDSFIWSVLKRYEELTGLKALINTSFNLHNNPIIKTELVGLDSWLKSDTDILVIGHVIIEKI